MSDVNCPSCGTVVQVNSTSLAITCGACGKEFNPKYPEGKPVKGFTKYDVQRQSATGPEQASSEPVPFMKKPAVRVAFGVLAIFAAVMAVVRLTQAWDAMSDSEPAGPAGWHRYRDDTGGFTIWFPAEPEKESLPTFGNGVGVLRIAQYSADGETVEVAWTDTRVLPDKDIDNILDRTMEAYDAELISRKQTEHQGIPAVFGAGKSAEGDLSVMVLVTNNKAFLLTVRGPGDYWKKFIDSFFLDREQRTGPTSGK